MSTIKIPFFQIGKNKQFITYSQITDMYTKNTGLPVITNADMKDIGFENIEKFDKVRYTNQLYLEVLKDFVNGKNIRTILPQEFHTVKGKTDLDIAWNILTGKNISKFLSISQKAIYGHKRFVVIREPRVYRPNEIIFSNNPYTISMTNNNIFIKYNKGYTRDDIRLSELAYIIDNLFVSFDLRVRFIGSSTIAVQLK